MKRFISTFTFIVMVLLAAACTDLSGVNARLDDHDKRLKALEGLVANANTNIQALQNLLDAEAGKITITQWDETAEGYVLTMSDGSKITLNHGKDGSSPAVGMKEFNGVMYWTLNGEFLLDADGNKIKAEGQDGTSGTTPRIRVDAEGYWEVSLDGGKTWQAVTDTNGQKVKAVGSDASIDLVITEDENGIKIVYDGKEFIIPKTPNPTDRPKLSIEYVAEYNMAQSDLSTPSFAKSNSNENGVTGYYTWEDAKILIGNLDGFHLPSNEEWFGIIPENMIIFNSTKTITSNIEAINVNELKASFESEYNNTGESISYAIRFKRASKSAETGYDPYQDDSYKSAWRYELVSNTFGGNGKLLKITVRYIGDNTISLEEISNLDWWNNDSSNDIIRYFPCPGWTTITGSVPYPSDLGNFAGYWSSSDAYGSGYYIFINANSANLSEDYGEVYSYSIRPFSNE